MIKSSRTAHRYALGFLLACILTCATLTADASAAARPVTLAQAHVPPTFLSNLNDRTYVDAGDPATGYTCRNTTTGKGGYFTDVSAYTWKGGALGAQRWNADHTVMHWVARDGHWVTFDGIRFVNHSHTTVLVAGWCG